MMRAVLIASIFLATATSPIRAECRLDKISDVKPIIEQDRLYVPGKINDKPVLFILDTGSSQTVLFSNAAAALGLNVSGYGAQQNTSIETLDIGGLNGKNAYLRVIDRGEDSPLGGVPVAGIMGEDILSGSDIEISIKDGLFALYQPEGCENANLAHWTKNYNIAAMIHSDQPHAVFAGNHVLISHSDQPHIVMLGQLNDSPIKIQLATGNPVSVVSLEAAGSRGVGPDSQGTSRVGIIPGVLAAPTEGWVGSFGSFSLDEEKIAPVKIALVKFPKTDIWSGYRLGPAAGANLLLGFDFLRAHHVLISHSQQKVYFSYAGGAPFLAPKPQTSTPQ